MSEQNENAAPGGTTAVSSHSENELQTIVGGVELTVTHLPVQAFDESTLKRLEKFRALLGTSQTVKIRHVPVSLFARYANAVLNNEEGIAIEIYCGKDPGWSDTLELTSVNAIADKGLDINLDFLCAWLKRQAKLRDIQTPEAIVKLQTKLADLETMMRESLSRSSSEQTPSTTG